MYIEYSDIITRVAEKPVWWLNGVPRYEVFQPSQTNVYLSEAALVHTECQACGTRYDVGVTPRGRGRTLRNVLAFEAQLDIGDPPNACESRSRCTGSTMSSLQVAIIEYWERPSGSSAWVRDVSLERPLVDWGGFSSTTEHDPLRPVPIFLKIHNSDRRPAFQDAKATGNFAALLEILRDFGCDRPEHVAHMLDVENRDKKFRLQLSELDMMRFPPV